MLWVIIIHISFRRLRFTTFAVYSHGYRNNFDFFLTCAKNIISYVERIKKASRKGIPTTHRVLLSSNHCVMNGQDYKGNRTIARAAVILLLRSKEQQTSHHGHDISSPPCKPLEEGKEEVSGSQANSYY